ncbi:MAG TPA: WD40 repeat domain-containing protein [Rhizobiaceae bacterium]|nr:WD40 repeat domain-containing protein [Rhizobiaceae bacterium]
MRFLGRFLRLAALAAFAVSSAGISGGALAAEEIYGMAKFSLCKLPNHPFDYISMTSATAFSEDGARVAIGSDDRTVHVCETAGNVIKSIAVPSAKAEDDEYINFVALSADGSRLATASRDNMLRVWDVASGTEIATLKHERPIFFMEFSPDGSRIASAVGDTKVWLWDVATATEIAVLEHAQTIRSATFSPDGTRVVTADFDGAVRFWDAADGRKVADLAGHTKAVHEARFSADGTRIVTASGDGTARIFDAAKGIATLVLRHPAEVFSAAFSADGKLVVTGAANQAHIFDAALGRETLVLKGHEYEVNDANFSPDGTRIVTASSDGSIRVWDAASGEAVTVLERAHSSGSVDAAAFTPDGSRIISIGGPTGLAWTRLAPGSLPESAAGVWFADFGSPEQPLPPEIIRDVCVTMPIRVGADGLIVFFEGWGGGEPPRATMHLRCASETSCQVFAEAPAQGLEMQGEGSVTFADKRADLCLAGECRSIAQCAPVVWTDEEKASGFAAQWETAILGQAQ